MVRVHNKVNESFNHPDIGCVKAKIAGYNGKCVDCIFPKCLEDKKEKPATMHGKRYKMRDIRKRNKEICRLKNSGMKVDLIAAKYNIAEKTVYKVCHEGVK
jgi:DNA-binding NarL/FixJ family response regulator